MKFVVVGGGHAGPGDRLVLARQGPDFVILEASEEPAAAWRQRWDSLKLFTPARYKSLPGLAFPGDPAGYSTFRPAAAAERRGPGRVGSRG